jgi:hypothetical protein
VILTVAPFPSGISAPDMSETRIVLRAIKSLLVVPGNARKPSLATHGAPGQASPGLLFGQERIQFSQWEGGRMTRRFVHAVAQPALHPHLRKLRIVEHMLER